MDKAHGGGAFHLWLSPDTDISLLFLMSGARCQVQTENVVIQKGAVSLKTQVSFKSMTNGKGHSRIEHADLFRIKELLQ